MDLMRFDGSIDSPSVATYLMLKSGDAHRTATLGMDGTTLIASATWFFHRCATLSRCPSNGFFFGVTVLLSSDARLSLTGLNEKEEPLAPILHASFSSFPPTTHVGSTTVNNVVTL